MYIVYSHCSSRIFVISRLLKSYSTVYREISRGLSSICRSQWPRGLKRRSTAARLLRSWIRISPGVWMSVCCECFVLSGRGLCDELITGPEESYRLWCCPCVWSRKTNLVNEEAKAQWGVGGANAPRKKNSIWGKVWLYSKSSGNKTHTFIFAMAGFDLANGLRKVRSEAFYHCQWNT